ncbi:MAG TPA: hypothetical protein VLQ45_02305 [Thermoanaerobaculia bacterium]|nr:hypothetical protein [Thermoanaerobaculia bacterium]
MTNLLSAISGKFSTALILGTFFPVTVFVFLARVLWVPLLPAGFKPALLAPLAGLDDKWELLILTLVTIVLSGVLYNLNIPLIRFYEGYAWERTWIGRRKKARHRAALQALLAQQEGLYPLQSELLAEGRSLKAVDPEDPRIPRLRSWINAARAREYAVRREVFSHYPKEPSVLPTRLGNVIRSFENYPERQYRMAAITLWPRLIAVLDPAYADSIDSAKTGVDFMLNSATLSGLLCLLLLVTGLVYPSPLASDAALWWLLEIGGLAALSWWLYTQSIGGALDWGNLVRGAFDLYRGKLLEKLGYGRAPKSVDEERELWQAISSRLTAGDPPQDAGEIPPYERTLPPPTSCSCTSGAALELARGVVPLADGRGLRVVLEVRNPDADPGGPAVTDLIVADTVPEGFEYQWNSASASAGTVRVEGTNPYRFHLSASLAPKIALQLAYIIVPRAPAARVWR